MAMSVAEQRATTKLQRSPHIQLAVSSLLGAVFVLLSLWLVFGGLPYFWGEHVPLENEFLSGALLLIAGLLVGMGLWYVGYQLEKSHAQHGLRAGVFFGALFIFVIAWLCLSVIGPFLETRDLGAAGAIITAGVAVALLFGLVRVFTLPAFSTWLQNVED